MSKKHVALLVPIFWVVSLFAVGLAWFCLAPRRYVVFASMAIAASAAVGYLGAQLECGVPLSCDTVGADTRWRDVYVTMSAAVFAAAFVFVALVRRQSPSGRLSAGVWLMLSLCSVGVWAWTADLMLGIRLG